MHYMASQAVYKHDNKRLHDYHLDLQDHMPHPIAFLAEMMGDIMYYIRHYVSQMPGNSLKLS